MKRLLSFKYAFQGLKDMFRTQINARIHILSGIFATALSVWLEISRIEWVLIVLCIGWVLAAEAFNTAIEYLTDLVSPEHHVLAGKTKDAAAGAVLLSSISAVLVGLIIFMPKLWPRLAFFF